MRNGVRSGKLVTRLMVNDVIADPLDRRERAAAGAAAPLPRAAAETEQLGVTSRQVTLLWLIRSNPGLSLRELAAEERISAPALSGHVDRLEKAGLLERVRDESDRRRVGLALTERGRAAAEARPRPPHDLARRAAARPRRRRAGSARAPRSSRSGSFCDGGAARAQRAHLRQPPPAPQLPPLLHRPGDLGQRHLDAERRARLARRRADAARRSPSALLAFCRFVPFTVFGLFAGVVADRIDNRRLVIATQTVSMIFSATSSPRSCSPARQTLWLVYLLAILSGTALVFDAPGRHALTFQMVGRDELPNAVALNASLFNASRVVGPARRRRPDRRLRRRRLLRDQHGHVPRRARRAAADAAGGARPARAQREAADDDARRSARASPGCARSPQTRGSCSLIVTVVSTVGFNFHVILPLLASDTLDTGPEVFGILSGLLRRRRARRRAALGGARPRELEGARSSAPAASASRCSPSPR